jgi:hypothetical protein
MLEHHLTFAIRGSQRKNWPWATAPEADVAVANGLTPARPKESRPICVHNSVEAPPERRNLHACNQQSFL